MPRKEIAPPPEWQTAEYSAVDVAAIQALAQGTANPEQQQRALNFIIYKMAATHDLEYRPDERAHVFMSGRRFVGLQITTALKLNVSRLRDIENGSSGVGADSGRNRVRRGRKV